MPKMASTFPKAAMATRTGEGPRPLGSEFSGRKFELEREPKKVEVADAGDMAYEVGSYK